MSVKIAYLLGSLNRGGAETLLLDVFRNATKNGLDAIGIYRKTGMYEQDFIDSGVVMYKLPTGSNQILYLLSLRKLLLKNRIDIVHAQQPLDALYAYWATLGIGIKIVLTLHGYDFNDTGISRLILRYIIKRTDVNIYVSDTQRQYYLDKYKLDSRKQQVVYNGISFEKLDIDLDSSRSATLISTSNREKLRNELKLSRETNLIGTVGNFNLVRDQFTICRFLKLLNDQQVDFHFVFAGKRVDTLPELYDNCVRYCAENNFQQKVTFLGVRNDVPAILHELDAFIYSTDYDTFGIAVVEAMATELPVFVNDWGVMNEITDCGKYATIYKTKNELDLLQHFMLFLQNKQTYHTKAREAAAFVRQKYSIENHIAELKRVYEKMVNC